MKLQKGKTYTVKKGTPQSKVTVTIKKPITPNLKKKNRKNIA